MLEAAQGQFGYFLIALVRKAGPEVFAGSVLGSIGKPIERTTPRPAQ